MTRQAVFSRPGHFGSVEWELEDRLLHITPQGLQPETYSLREISSVAGDDYTIHLGYSGETLTLSRLGAEGAGLREQLLREWPAIRAEALRLTGAGEPRRYAGAYAALGGAPVPFSGLLYEEVLVIAPTGADVRPLFLSSLSQLTLDEAAYTITFRTWSKESGVFSRMGPKTGEFAAALDDVRTRLGAEAAEVAAAVLPTLPGAVRTALATRWLPGEMLTLAALEAGNPGLDAALRAGWMAAGGRGPCAETLLDWSDPERVFLGYERRPVAAESPLWLLTGKGDTWLLENLSEEDFATYRFRAGAEMSTLTSLLLKTRRFSREALYVPLDKLTGTRSDLAIPARDLPFLRDLRERFVERIIHDEPSGWSERVKSLG